MPSKVRIIGRPNSRMWDDLLQDVLDGGRLGEQHDYYGCANPERADSVRRHLRTAAKHLGVGAKVYYTECPNPGKCTDGGPDCTHHVYYTLFDMESARQYKAQQAAAAQQNRR